ncbi:hypothetical protein [Citrobacter amalonaticus]|uniref:hypothetical protein n=1 Tax=Citrobacter amalonaticus TaxID=35703 RepID=UPI001A2375A3|nr:hypothetical protein [Citrobacter amalonaticus]HDQ2814059.1 hypothetical protein [Citrobacter amalonaticus]
MNNNIIIEWQLLFVNNTVSDYDTEMTKKADECSMFVSQFGDVNDIRDDIVAIRKIASDLVTNKDIEVVLKRCARRQNVWMVFILLFFIISFWLMMTLTSV